MKTPLVSIVTPCYNGERFLDTYFNSILNQTYKNFEIIFVNDGSTDGTEKKALFYKAKFEKNGNTFKYLKKENGGAASAVNVGLKLVTGEYITWPDSDDIWENTYLSKCVDYLEKAQEVGIVFPETNIIREKEFPKVKLVWKVKYNEPTNIFKGLLGENVDVGLAVGVARAKALFDVLPDREIIVDATGQNWQLLLPLLYKYKAGFIKEPLYNYIIRNASHSHIELGDYEKLLKRTYIHEGLLNKLVVDVIDMTDEDRKYYLNFVKEKYLKKRFYLAYEYKIKKDIIRFYKEAKFGGISELEFTYIYSNAVNPIKGFFIKLYLLPKRLFNKKRHKND